jgi:hypothetical protein
VAPAGKGVGEVASSVRSPALDGERADGADPALIDEQVTAVGAQPGIDRPDPAGLADRGAAQQDQRAARGEHRHRRRLIHRTR